MSRSHNNSKYGLLDVGYLARLQVLLFWENNFENVSPVLGENNAGYISSALIVLFHSMNWREKFAFDVCH